MQIRLLTLVAVMLFAAQTAFAQSGEPHLYFFTSPNCGPCRQVEPEIHLLVSKNYPVTIVDINQRQDLARQFNVNRTPVTILVSDNKVAGRKAGLIDARTIAGWFQTANATRAQSKLVENKSAGPAAAPARNRIAPARNTAPTKTRPEMSAAGISSTVHRGTRTPNSDTEFNAMRATVRLKVEDPKGISFATGTVIHSQNGECLVLTCGHVFRDARGTGTITGDLGFEGSQLKTYPGKLVTYDAGPRDIGLVIIETGYDIPAVTLAPPSFPIQRGDQVFTLGCDHGQDATIRRTRIKNQALYDQAKKYDIYGRPVDGRSGGGLFTAGGQLIGVCNAAAVEVDEGVYTSLENIYGQIAKVNLTHLFEPNRAIARQLPPQSPTQRDLRGLVSTNRGGLETNPAGHFNPQPKGGPLTIADTQVIVVLQSKSRPEQTETLIIKHPTQEFLAQLRAQQSSGPDNREDRFAELRREMPRVPKPGNRQQFRAQSPR